MAAEFFIASRWRDKSDVERLVKLVRQKGRTIYCFLEAKDAITRGVEDPEQFMQNFEQLPDWTRHPDVIQAFETDMAGLRGAEKVILLLPAGKSAHIEAGVAYGLGKHLILIGEQTEAESLYLIFNEMFTTIDQFIESL